MKGEMLAKAIESVTDPWRKQRKREERGRPEVKDRRRRVMYSTGYEYSSRVTIKEVAYSCMREAYMKVSGGTLPAQARQIMYAARPTILEEAHDRHGQPYKGFTDNYFIQGLLTKYMEVHDCSDWDVVFDARGHLAEPHADETVPLGTLEVRGYLQDIEAGCDDDISYKQTKSKYPTCGPANRFGAILFIEKEGFLPLFDAVKLAERYDIAIMSTKGMSVTAARTLAENVCGDHGVPLLILRDFDKAGFSIAASFQKDTHRFQFAKSFRAVDLGLRLEDVESWKLVSEPVHYESDPRRNLEENGATPEEITFLCEGSSGKNCYGQRVELNAFTSNDIIKWIEGKLKEHGVKKIVPDEDTLKAAYARGIKIATINKAIEDALDDAEEAAEKQAMPKTLGRMIRKAMKDDPTRPWDKIVAAIAAENHED